MSQVAAIRTINTNFAAVREATASCWSSAPTASAISPCGHSSLTGSVGSARWSSHESRCSSIAYAFPDSKLPAPIQRAQQEFDASLARALTNMADRLEGMVGRSPKIVESPFDQLEGVVEGCCPVKPSSRSPRNCRRFVYSAGAPTPCCVRSTRRSDRFHNRRWVWPAQSSFPSTSANLYTHNLPPRRVLRSKFEKRVRLWFRREGRIAYELENIFVTLQQHLINLARCPLILGKLWVKQTAYMDSDIAATRLTLWIRPRNLLIRTENA
jgi:hypothetical protein